MNELIKYLKHRFRISADLFPLKLEERNKLPVYMRNYELFFTKVHNQKLLFVNMGDNKQYTTADYKRRAELIEKTFNMPVVFVIENLEAYKRLRMIEKNIAFIVPGKQLYIPLLFIDLKEYKNIEKRKTEKIAPAAQCLLLYYLLGNNIDDLNFKTLAEKLSYGNMTITRAAEVLNAKGLAEITGGKEKHLKILNNKKNLWNNALPYLSSPVEKEIYTEKTDLKGSKYITGINALAEYTDITGEYRNIFAVSGNSFKQLKTDEFYGVIHEPEEDTETIQVWKYDPGILTNNNVVDPLSLFLSLKDTRDERVEKELDKLLETLW